MGDRLPADHNYRLYSALVDQINSLKEFNWQLGTITGVPDGDGWIKLGRESYLMMRTSFEHISLLNTLDDKIIRVGQNLIQLGISEGESFQPVDRLKSRIVTIKAKDNLRIEPFEFGVALGKQLRDLGVEAMPILGDRKTLQIKDKRIIGYGVKFEALKPSESKLLQIHGLGGRRKIGGGVFV
jgi:CRISPR-associated protein Cas6